MQNVQVAELQEKLRLAILETKEEKSRAEDTRGQLQALQGLREADLIRAEEEALYRNESVRAKVQTFETLLSKAEAGADDQLAASRKKLYDAVAMNFTGTESAFKRETVRLWRCAASICAAERKLEATEQMANDSERGRTEMSNRLRSQVAVTEETSAKYMRYRAIAQQHLIRLHVRRSSASVLVEWKGVLNAAYICQRIVAFCNAHTERAAKRRSWEIWKVTTAGWRRLLRANRVSAESFRQHCYRVGVAFFYAWRDLRRATVCADKRILKIVFRCLYLTVLKAWNTWWDIVREHRRLKVAATRISQRFRLVSDTSTSRWYSAWRLLTRESHQLKTSARRAMRRWLHLTLWSVFANWENAVKTRKRRKFVNTKIMRSWLLYHCRRAFHTWKDMMLSNKRLVWAAMRAIRKWISNTCQRAFHSWLSCVMEQSRLRHSASKVLRRWFLHTICSAFTAWRSMATAQRRAFKSAVRVLNRWTRFHVHQAFGAWFVGATQAKRHAAVGAKIVRRWMYLTVSHAFHSWVAMTQHEQRVVAVSAHILQRWMGFGVWRSFDTWVDAAQQARAGAERQQALVAAAMRVIRRWVSRTTSSSFQAWAAAAVESKRLCAAHRRALQKWLRIGVMQRFSLAP